MAASGWTRAARAHIEDLVARYALPEALAERFLALLGIVVDDPLAPTAVREPIKVLEDHIADSLVALELDEVRRASTISDLGAGAGFPGLPLAIALPAARLALVESSARKCAFLERAILSCEANNASVVNARAESWPDGLGRFDLITARALAPLEVVAEYAAPLLRVGGALVVWRGRRDRAAEASAADAATTLGLEPREPRPVVPYEGSLHRHLYLMLKVGDTPERFPRRPGMARRRPLGAGRHAV